MSFVYNSSTTMISAADAATEAHDSDRSSLRSGPLMVTVRICDRGGKVCMKLYLYSTAPRQEAIAASASKSAVTELEQI